jgi:hypothetical protein
MSGDIPPLPQYAFMAWCLVKHRDNFTFTLTLLLRLYLHCCLLNACSLVLKTLYQVHTLHSVKSQGGCKLILKNLNGRDNQVL